MDNLALPNLRELFLHRNAITRIGHLGGCPRLRKLWLFQNQIEVVTGLHAVPELEECWLQANQISKLQGFETLSQLYNLGLAGNPVSDFKELKRLNVCGGLRALSMSDIHFGRCPIADEAGYQEFVVLHLPQVSTLDGIAITRETQLSAEDLYYSHVTSRRPINIIERLGRFIKTHMLFTSCVVCSAFACVVFLRALCQCSNLQSSFFCTLHS
jgi:Leucine-rich repeat (LRR) protein